MTNIKDYPELVNPLDEDWILIQENKTIPAYKKTKLANIKNNSSSGNSGASTNWGYRDGSANFSLSGGKYLIDTPTDVTINLENIVEGIEIELLRLSADNSLFLNGISKVNGDDIDIDASVSLPFNDIPSRLIYVNSVVGWIFIPKSNIRILSP